MPESAWKYAERRICRMLGGDRRGPTGRADSDCVGCDGLSVSVKRSKRGVPLGAWLQAAREFGRKEGAEWALVVVRPGQDADDAIVCIRLGYLTQLRDAEKLVESQKRYRPIRGQQPLI